MEKKVVIDTNILVEYLRGRKRILERLIVQKETEELIISSITILELFAGRSTKDRQEEQKVRSLIGEFSCVEVNKLIAEKGGKILRDYPQIHQMADAVIAATALLEKAYLATLNKKHYQGVKGLKFWP